ncbi:Phage major capsid protein [Elusimicrobium minutum Pei191]|uniref:Phage major capsid protein n=1 Tax=Elusimicrobium minutum (strain Pei191) TaxID=445932 RepID=B2KDP2_ELUMP|nr:phage major capsid protein [Elusimicrobium minutum]ACC98638.1 Phage major capsid protein [Elusimicrobium minutum Pei191]
MDEIMQSIKELRKTLETKIDSCITKEKAENIVSDLVKKVHPEQRKALLPTSADDVLERFAEFSKSSKHAPEKPWTSDYGRKFGNMKNFLLAAKDRHASFADSKSVLAESGAGGGGYLVPTEFSNHVARIMADISPIMQIANVVPMGSWKRQIPKQISNLSVGWVAENGVRGINNPAFGQIEQVAKVMATVIKCTDELIRDSAINLTQFLSELVAEAMALEVERVSLVGDTAAGDPFNGVYNTAGLQNVTMGGQNVSFDDIANLIFQLNDANAAGSVLVLSRTGLSKLLKLKDSNGNYLWQPPAGGAPATIWNTPYVVSSKIPNDVDGDKTIALFGRFNKHLLISPRQEMAVKVSQDASSWNAASETADSAFMLDQTWLRFTQALSIDVTFGSAFSCLKFK